jgi:hypothetical protein
MSGLVLPVSVSSQGKNPGWWSLTPFFAGKNAERMQKEYIGQIKGRWQGVY